MSRQESVFHFVRTIPRSHSQAFHLNVDLRRTPLIKRKARLCEFVSRSAVHGCCTRSTSRVEGKELFNEICRCDLEGIDAKRKMGLYREDRPDWLKIRNRTYSQAGGRHELLTTKTEGRHG